MDQSIKLPCGIDTIKARVERILGELMRVEVHVDRNDPRIISIHEDILREYNGKKTRIPDEEIKGYVKKYYRFRAVVEGSDTS